MTLEKLAGAIDTAHELRDKIAQKVVLMDKLIRALAHEWAKEAGVTNVSFDVRTYNRLKVAYAQAVREGVTQFTFEGNEYLVAYAKYLIEYLSTQFERGERR